MNELAEKIQKLPGPILVLGASGFVGANLFRSILKHRTDVYGTFSQSPAWRLEGLPEKCLVATDLLIDANIKDLIARIRPHVVFNCVAYGGYSFQGDVDLIYRTNLGATALLLEELANLGATYIHAGTSSEYGDAAAGPVEDRQLLPNSHYAASKAGASGLIHYMGKRRGLACANLRLYSVYGPYEDSSRLVPALIMAGVKGTYPPFADPDISRDFVYVDDVCEAFVDAAIALRHEHYGESFNIGTGKKTRISDLAKVAQDVFGIPDAPKFSTFENRKWDVTDWYSDPKKARDALGWSARTDLRQGLAQTTEWFRQVSDPDSYRQRSKQNGPDRVRSVSAIIACYKDGQAIPIMYERLVKVFRKLHVEYEIIFVNDCSPDGSEEVIAELSRNDRSVIGITHSRNFGSQSAFRSGMEIATKNACVLLDGDLQDPPELIEEFVKKWKEGYDVVYGRRVKREAPLFMQLSYKLFYIVFRKFSYIDIPRDAGDFSLIDKRVVRCLLRFPERDLFLRGIRAFAGFKQAGVDYFRAERMFGRSTNNLFKNIGWAKKGILSFSKTPLDILSFAGSVLFVVTLVLMVIQIVVKLLYWSSAPAGITTVLLIVTFFGSVNLFAVGILGEYLGKVFEEVKGRPHYIRKSIIKGGVVRKASEEISPVPGA